MPSPLISGALPRHAATPAHGGAPRPTDMRRPSVALALAVGALALGFLLLPLLGSVVAVVMGSLGLQAWSQGRASEEARRRFGTAMWLGVAGLALWIPLAVIAAIVREAG